MITPKIKALFQFIDFLHSNIDNFKQYDEVISEYNLLCKEQQKESPRKNFASKLKYDEVQAEKNDMFKVIKESIIQPLQTKATELKICDWNNTETLWNYNISEINSIKKNFSKDDLPEIFKYKSKYIDYRTKTNGSYSQDSFFKDLDEVLKELFGYFKKETERNEFEAFESKAMKVNDSFLNPPKTQQPQNKPSQPQQTKEEKEQEQPTFVNNFDNINPIVVYGHFKAGLVEKGYLTEQELSDYLKTAFELQTIPETLFSLRHTPTKQRIYTVFYTYYKDIAGKKHKQQIRYVELLSNYFEGYKTDIVKTNWAKEYKAKR